ncbi:diacylglycerol kinase family protein, partial [Mesorhizobium sp. M7A.F.Ca.ET.027.02.1.1]|uniref:diacylglycerol kinase family protein n=1 Tax=Mesorhizobium sp. M7A.F.Ca.ET.027.02.1.1 TaxID=2496655 RepID=UPI0032AF9959
MDNGIIGDQAGITKFSCPPRWASSADIRPCPAARCGLQCRQRIRGAERLESLREGCLKVGVVLNPIAGGGRLKRHWPDVAVSLKKHFGEFELRETQAEGDAERLAIDLAMIGFD